MGRKKKANVCTIVEEKPEIKVINTIPLDRHMFDNYHGNLWDESKWQDDNPDRFKPGTPIIPPMKTIFKEDTNLNIVISGPTGGGKTSAAVAIAIFNGFLRGKRVFSVVPINFHVKSNANKTYLVKSEEFDLVRFVDGDPMYMNSIVLLDEANFSVDVKKTMSNLNIGITDILQEGRKLDMWSVFTVLNPYWLDSRILSTMADIKIDCRDLFFTAWGKKRHLRKGEVTAWDLHDISGKYTGRQWFHMGKRTFQNFMVWGYFDTHYFIRPSQQRKQIVYQKRKITIDQNGNECDPEQWMQDKLQEISELAKKEPEWAASELWEKLNIRGVAEMTRVGTVLRHMGITKKQNTIGERIYDLSPLVGANV